MRRLKFDTFLSPFVDYAPGFGLVNCVSTGGHPAVAARASPSHGSLVWLLCAARIFVHYGVVKSTHAAGQGPCAGSAGGDVEYF